MELISRQNPSDRAVDLLRAVGDLVLIALGVIVMLATPGSLQTFGLHEPAASVWAAAVTIGAAAALVTGYTGHLIAELWSCLLVIGGLLLWVIALTWPPDTTLIKTAVALAVTRAIIGECVRIADTIGERKATR